MAAKVVTPALFDRDAPRKAVNLSLNEDLVSRAKALTRNLYGTVEHLLAGYLRDEHARKQAEDDRLDQVVAALNAFHEHHRFMSDEFSDL